jgi:methanogenic corrinoid protein MtbC1
MASAEYFHSAAGPAPALSKELQYLRSFRLYTLSYRSSAKEIPTEAAMAALLSQSRERNRALGVTGTLEYKDGYFQQWLEGPRSAVTEIWRSIRNDPRHGEIELLNEGVVAARVFGRWDMRWSHRGDRSRLLNPAGADQSGNIRRLARLAIKGDHVAIEGLASGLIGPHEDVKSLYSPLFEPAERLLGDWWRSDYCSELDVTLALGALQLVARRLVAAPSSKPKIVVREVLLAAQPGEPHGLGVVLASDFFREARWSVQVEFPPSDQVLGDIVHNGWFDAVSLSLSDVFPRDQWLPRMAETIRSIREASSNRNVVVLAGGRAFAPDWRFAAAAVGADIGFASAVEAVDQTGLAILRRLTHPFERGERSSALGTPETLRLLAHLPLGWHALPMAPRPDEDGP